MSIFLRRDFYRPNIADDVYNMARSYLDRWRVGSKLRHHRELELFTCSGSLELVALDFRGPIARIKNRKQFVLLVTDRYSLLTQTLPITKITLTQIANIFFNKKIIF